MRACSGPNSARSRSPALFEPLQQEFAATAARRNLCAPIMPSSAVACSDPLMLRRILQEPARQRAALYPARHRADGMPAERRRYLHRGALTPGRASRKPSARPSSSSSSAAMPAPATRPASASAFRSCAGSPTCSATTSSSVHAPARVLGVLGHGAAHPDPVAIPVREQASVDYRYGGDGRRQDPADRGTTCRAPRA